MRVILKERLEHLGHIGDVVEVSNGYARNYLFPRKLAIVADLKKIKEMEHYKRVLKKKRLAQRASAEELVEHLKDYTLTLKRKVAPGDKLYGSVNVTDIVSALNQAGFPIKKQEIKLEHPLKSLGVYPVLIQLQADVKVSIKVWIAKEEEEKK